jgi:hypothetical protein
LARYTIRRSHGSEKHIRKPVRGAVKLFRRFEVHRFGLAASSSVVNFAILFVFVEVVLKNMRTTEPVQLNVGGAFVPDHPGVATSSGHKAPPTFVLDRD